MTSRAQIVATIGPSSKDPNILRKMIEAQMDIVRINFAWFPEDDISRIDTIRSIAAEYSREIPIIADLPGPRIQLAEGHTYDSSISFAITEKEEEMVDVCATKGVEYVALSFVGSAADVEQYRALVRKHNGSQKLIAKIERKAAVDAVDSIIAAADAVMIARGDLGNEVPLEEIPFIEKMIIEKANAAGKPVIVATQMLLSMVEHVEPTRAEVTDVEEAVTCGADAVMLSEETASGKHPVEAVAMMKRIITAAEAHRTVSAHHSL